MEKPCRNITSFYLGSSAILKLERRRQSEKEETREREAKGLEEKGGWREREGGQAKTLI